METNVRKLSDDEKRAWLRAKGQVRSAPHAFTKRICHWPYCARCGLMLLKNKISQKAAMALCTWEE